MEMTVEEKRDILLEVLADYYEVREAAGQDIPILNHKIKVLETRLKALGTTDFSDLKP